jgi:hypothetical protein
VYQGFHSLRFVLAPEWRDASYYEFATAARSMAIVHEALDPVPDPATAKIAQKSEQLTRVYQSAVAIGPVRPVITRIGPGVAGSAVIAKDTVEMAYACIPLSEVPGDSLFVTSTSTVDAAAAALDDLLATLETTAAEVPPKTDWSGLAVGVVTVSVPPNYSLPLVAQHAFGDATLIIEKLPVAAFPPVDVATLVSPFPGRTAQVVAVGDAVAHLRDQADGTLSERATTIRVSDAAGGSEHTTVHDFVFSRAGEDTFSIRLIAPDARAAETAPLLGALRTTLRGARQ